MKTNLENYEERFVDYMEGQLDAAGMRDVEAFVAHHPELEEEFKLFLSTKLEPDTSVVFTKKDHLMRPATAIRPLYSKLVAAAACLALLIGIGIRFLKPQPAPERHPMLAELTPLEAQPIAVVKEVPSLRKSNLKPISVQRTTIKADEVESIEPFELIACVPPIKPRAITENVTIAYDEIEIRMDVELGERLALLAPLTDVPMEVNLHDYLIDNIGQTAKSLYKKTAKAVMDVYYTTDYRLKEAREELMASQ